MIPTTSRLFVLSVLLFSVAAFTQSGSAQTQKKRVLTDLFSNQSKKNSTPSKKRTSTSSRSSSSTKRNSSSKPKPDFLTQLTGKTPEERAKAEYARKKAAAAKAKAEARAKSIADAAKKKADEQKARELAAREKQRAMNRAADLAKRKTQEAQRAKELAEKKRADEARKAALAEKRLKEERARQLLAAARAKEDARRRLADERLREQQLIDSQLVAQAHGRKPRGGGLFGFRSRTTTLSANMRAPAVPSPPSRYLYINEREISSLNSSNSRIEIDLSDQRARIYRGSTLVIETQISSGKSGFKTPTGRYSVKEKIVDKQSGRYGTWYNSGGVQLRGDDHDNPPPGASKFVGADMPYWMRITGGIGMHVGYVPNGPASHGCIRVPSNVQPLIFSKVKVGTPVTIKS